MSSSLLRPELAAIAADLEAAQARLHRLASTLPAERWAARRDPARWSVAECVTHLNLTSQAFAPLMAAAIADAQRLGRPARSRFRRDVMGWVLGWLVGPMPRLFGRRIGRVKTPAAFVPGAARPRAEVMAEFDWLQAALMDVVQASNDLPIDGVTIVSPFDARARYSLYSALVIVPRHQHRHAQQAEDVWR